MNLNLTIHDENPSGSILNLMKLPVDRASLSLRELIRIRVYEEARAYNRKRTRCFRGLVRPAQAEPVLNGYRLRPRRKLDPEALYHITMHAFNNQGFSVWIDEEKIEDPDRPIRVGNRTRIRFLRIQAGDDSLTYSI